MTDLDNYIKNNLHKITIDKLDTKMIGIVNLGNTCYLNSILQILLNTNEIIEFFKDSKIIKFLYIFIQNNLSEDKHNYSKIITNCSYTLSYQLYKLLNSKNILLKPINFIKILSNFNNIFYENIQHDAHEALQFILDRIHIELETNVDIEYNDKIDNILYIKDAIEQNFKISYSIIKDIFSYIYIESLKCNECNYISYKNGFEYIIFLEIFIDENTINKKLSEFSNLDDNKKSYIKNNITSNLKISIYDCLDNYTKDEILDNSNKWICPICNKYVNAIKKINFLIPPKLLIIVIKRFNDNLNKYYNVVNFPLENFSLKSYLHETSRDLYDHIYDLYGVVNHIGTINKGHYFTFIKKNIKWYCLNDEKIIEIRDSNVISQHAYILFYRLRIFS